MTPELLEVLKEELKYQIARHDLEYADNVRYARCDNAEQMAEYNRKIERGCCGRFDHKFKYQGVEYTVGCNYGH